MNILSRIAVFGGILLACAGCGRDLPPAPPVPLNQALCYQLQSRQYAEQLQVRFSAQADSVLIEGRAIAFVSQQLQDIQGKGLYKSGAWEVELVLTDPSNGQISKQRERWAFEGANLRIAGRQTTLIPADQMLLRRVQCPNAAVDSSLYEQIGAFHEGHAAVVKGGRYGLIDAQGKVKIPPRYDFIGNLGEGVAVFADSFPDNRFGLIDFEGRVLVEPRFLKIAAMKHGLAAALPDLTQKGWGFIDRKGEWKIAPSYQQINLHDELPDVAPFSEGLANVAVDGLWGYIDTSGKTVVPYEFIGAEAFQGGQAKVYTAEKWFYIDKTGKCVQNCQ